jgi:hypothetical protein
MYRVVEDLLSALVVTLPINCPTQTLNPSLCLMTPLICIVHCKLCIANCAATAVSEGLYTLHDLLCTIQIRGSLRRGFRVWVGTIDQIQILQHLMKWGWTASSTIHAIINLSNGVSTSKGILHVVYLSIQLYQSIYK